MYKDSAIKVALAGITVKSGRKWQAHEAMSRTEAQDLSGYSGNGEGSLGSLNRKHQLVKDEIWAKVGKEHHSKMVSMSK